MRELPAVAQTAILGYAEKVWEDLRAEGGKLRLTLDHVRKMWALGRPDFTTAGAGLGRPATVLFLDEAQDTPPVLARVVAEQRMRKVIVGDQDQAIYTFTGAVDFLATAAAQAELPLTKSWRFGPQIADIGNRFLELLDSNKRIEGGGPASQVLTDVSTMTGADAILVRSNAAAIGEIARELAAGRKVGVPKGVKKELTELVETARYLQGRARAPYRMHDDLAPFRDWSELCREADKGDDPKLAMLVGMVERDGVDALSELVDRVQETAKPGGGLDKVEFRDSAHGVIAEGDTYPHRVLLRRAGFARLPDPAGTRYRSGSKKGELREVWIVEGPLEHGHRVRDHALELARPDVMVSTAHKAKGLEWDRVRIGEDFRGPKSDPSTGDTIFPAPEELRLAYVAVTRARTVLDPGSLAYVFDYTSTNGGIPAPTTAPPTTTPEALVHAPVPTPARPQPDSAPAPTSEEPAAPQTGTRAQIGDIAVPGSAPSEQLTDDHDITVHADTDGDAPTATAIARVESPPDAVEDVRADTAAAEPATGENDTAATDDGAPEQPAVPATDPDHGSDTALPRAGEVRDHEVVAAAFADWSPGRVMTQDAGVALEAIGPAWIASLLRHHRYWPLPLSPMWTPLDHPKTRRSAPTTITTDDSVANVLTELVGGVTIDRRYQARVDATRWRNLVNDLTVTARYSDLELSVMRSVLDDHAHEHRHRPDIAEHLARHHALSGLRGRHGPEALTEAITTYLHTHHKRIVDCSTDDATERRHARRQHGLGYRELAHEAFTEFDLPAALERVDTAELIDPLWEGDGRNTYQRLRKQYHNTAAAITDLVGAAAATPVFARFAAEADFHTYSVFAITAAEQALLDAAAAAPETIDGQRLRDFTQTAFISDPALRAHLAHQIARHPRSKTAPLGLEAALGLRPQPPQIERFLGIVDHTETGEAIIGIHAGPHRYLLIGEGPSGRTQVYRAEDHIVWSFVTSSRANAELMDPIRDDARTLAAEEAELEAMWRAGTHRLDYSPRPDPPVYAHRREFAGLDYPAREIAAAAAACGWTATAPATTSTDNDDVILLLEGDHDDARWRMRLSWPRRDIGARCAPTGGWSSVAARTGWGSTVHDRAPDLPFVLRTIQASAPAVDLVAHFHQQQTRTQDRRLAPLSPGRADRAAGDAYDIAHWQASALHAYARLAADPADEQALADADTAETELRQTHTIARGRAELAAILAPDDAELDQIIDATVRTLVYGSNTNARNEFRATLDRRDFTAQQRHAALAVLDTLTHNTERSADTAPSDPETSSVDETDTAHDDQPGPAARSTSPAKLPRHQLPPTPRTYEGISDPPDLLALAETAHEHGCTVSYRWRHGLDRPAPALRLLLRSATGQHELLADLRWLPGPDGTYTYAPERAHAPIVAAGERGDDSAGVSLAEIEHALRSRPATVRYDIATSATELADQIVAAAHSDTDPDGTARAGLADAGTAAEFIEARLRTELDAAERQRDPDRLDMVLGLFDEVPVLAARILSRRPAPATPAAPGRADLAGPPAATDTPAPGDGVSQVRAALLELAQPRLERNIVLRALAASALVSTMGNPVAAVQWPLARAAVRDTYAQIHTSAADSALVQDLARLGVDAVELLRTHLLGQVLGELHATRPDPWTTGSADPETADLHISTDRSLAVGDPAGAHIVLSCTDPAADQPDWAAPAGPHSSAFAHQSLATAIEQARRTLARPDTTAESNTTAPAANPATGQTNPTADQPPPAARIVIVHNENNTLVHGTTKTDTDLHEALHAAKFKFSHNIGDDGAWYLQRNWRYGTRSRRVAQLQVALDRIGVAYHNQTTPFTPPAPPTTADSAAREPESTTPQQPPGPAIPEGQHTATEPSADTSPAAEADGPPTDRRSDPGPLHPGHGTRGQPHDGLPARPDTALDSPRLSRMRGGAGFEAVVEGAVRAAMADELADEFCTLAPSLAGEVLIERMEFVLTAAVESMAAGAVEDGDHQRARDCGAVLEGVQAGDLARELAHRRWRAAQPGDNGPDLPADSSAIVTAGTSVQMVHLVVAEQTARAAWVTPERRSPASPGTSTDRALGYLSARRRRLDAEIDLGSPRTGGSPRRYFDELADTDTAIVGLTDPARRMRDLVDAENRAHAEVLRADNAGYDTPTRRRDERAYHRARSARLRAELAVTDRGPDAALLAGMLAQSEQRWAVLAGAQHAVAALATVKDVLPQHLLWEGDRPHHQKFEDKVYAAAQSHVSDVPERVRLAGQLDRFMTARVFPDAAASSVRAIIAALPRLPRPQLSDREPPPGASRLMAIARVRGIGIGEHRWSSYGLGRPDQNSIYLLDLINPGPRGPEHLRLRWGPDPNSEAREVVFDVTESVIIDPDGDSRPAPPYERQIQDLLLAPMPRDLPALVATERRARLFLEQALTHPQGRWRWNYLHTRHLTARAARLRGELGLPGSDLDREQATRALAQTTTALAHLAERASLRAVIADRVGQPADWWSIDRAVTAEILDRIDTAVTAAAAGGCDSSTPPWRALAQSLLTARGTFARTGREVRFDTDNRRRALERLEQARFSDGSDVLDRVYAVEPGHDVPAEAAELICLARSMQWQTSHTWSPTDPEGRARFTATLTDVAEGGDHLELVWWCTGDTVTFIPAESGVDDAAVGRRPVGVADVFARIRRGRALTDADDGAGRPDLDDAELAEVFTAAMGHRAHGDVLDILAVRSEPELLLFRAFAGPAAHQVITEALTTVQDTAAGRHRPGTDVARLAGLARRALASPADRASLARRAAALAWHHRVPIAKTMNGEELVAELDDREWDSLVIDSLDLDGGERITATETAYGLSLQLRIGDHEFDLYTANGPQVRTSDGHLHALPWPMHALWRHRNADQVLPAIRHYLTEATGPSVGATPAPPEAVETAPTLTGDAALPHNSDAEHRSPTPPDPGPPPPGTEQPVAATPVDTEDARPAAPRPAASTAAGTADRTPRSRRKAAAADTDAGAVVPTEATAIAERASENGWRVHRSGPNPDNAQLYYKLELNAVTVRGSRRFALRWQMRDGVAVYERDQSTATHFARRPVGDPLWRPTLEQVHAEIGYAALDPALAAAMPGPDVEQPIDDAVVTEVLGARVTEPVPASLWTAIMREHTAKAALVAADTDDAPDWRALLGAQRAYTEARLARLSAELDLEPGTWTRAGQREQRLRELDGARSDFLAALRGHTELAEQERHRLRLAITTLGASTGTESTQATPPQVQALVAAELDALAAVRAAPDPDDRAALLRLRTAHTEAKIARLHASATTPGYDNPLPPDEHDSEMTGALAELGGLRATHHISWRTHDLITTSPRLRSAGVDTGALAALVDTAIWAIADTPDTASQTRAQLELTLFRQHVPDPDRTDLLTGIDHYIRTRTHPAPHPGLALTAPTEAPDPAAESISEAVDPAEPAVRDRSPHSAAPPAPDAAPISTLSDPEATVASSGDALAMVVEHATASGPLAQLCEGQDAQLYRVFAAGTAYEVLTELSGEHTDEDTEPVDGDLRAAARALTPDHEAAEATARSLARAVWQRRTGWEWTDALGAEMNPAFEHFGVHVDGHIDDDDDPRHHYEIEVAQQRFFIVSPQAGSSVYQIIGQPADFGYQVVRGEDIDLPDAPSAEAILPVIRQYQHERTELEAEHAATSSVPSAAAQIAEHAEAHGWHIEQHFRLPHPRDRRYELHLHSPEDRDPPIAWRLRFDFRGAFGPFVYNPARSSRTIGLTKATGHPLHQVLTDIAPHTRPDTTEPGPPATRPAVTPPGTATAPPRRGPSGPSEPADPGIVDSGDRPPAGPVTAEETGDSPAPVTALDAVQRNTHDHDSDEDLPAPATGALLTEASPDPDSNDVAPERNWVHPGVVTVPSGKRARARANMDVIEMLAHLDEQDRPAHGEEAALLATWSGWGAVPEIFDTRKTDWDTDRERLRTLLGADAYDAATDSTLNGHYTDPAIAAQMWKALVTAGFTGGPVLEPGAGAGTFVGLAPESADMIAVEIDPTSARVIHRLYPQASVRQEGFEHTRLPSGSLVAAIGNVPFGKWEVRDPTYNPRGHVIHNAFILKALEMTAPGGYVAMLTSAYTMDARTEFARADMLAAADFVGAVRLPSAAFTRVAGTPVVTDIVVLRKRQPPPDPAEPPPVPPDISARNRLFLTSVARDHIDAVTGEPTKLWISGWFDEHPEYVLGEIEAGHGMYRGGSLNVTHEDLSLLPGQVGDALSQIVRTASVSGLGLTARAEHLTVHAEAPAGLRVRDPDQMFSFPIGMLRYNDTSTEFEAVTEFGTWEPVKVYRNRADETRALLHLRDLARRLITTQREDLGEHERGQARARLNRAYDEYVRRYGPVNRFTWQGGRERTEAERDNRFRDLEKRWRIRHGDADDKPYAGELPDEVFEELDEKAWTAHARSKKRTHLEGAIGADPTMAAVLALEEFDDRTGSATKSTIFTNDVLTTTDTITSTSDPAQALSISIGRGRGVDLAYIGELLGVAEDTVRDRLAGQVFADPDRPERLVAAPKYLSGDVRAKLVRARLAAASDPAFAENVTALEAVQPPWREAARIKVQPGTVWIPASDHADFARETFGLAEVKASRASGVMRFSSTSAASEKEKAWGTHHVSATDLLEALCNGTSIVVHHTAKEREAGAPYIDIKSTAQAQAQADRIRTEFRRWLWADEDRRERLVGLFNNTFNCFVAPRHDGRALHLPGLSSQRIPYDYQLGAAARGINEPVIQLDHAVGAGKTTTMLLIGWGLRSLGLIRQPWIVVPDHIVDDVVIEATQWFPSAEVLAGPPGLGPSERRRFVAQTATTSWDFVIVAMTTFESIGVKPARRERYIQDQLAELDERMGGLDSADTPDRSFKDLLRARKQLKKRLEKLTDKPKDLGLTLEDSGLDYLLADEFHFYKNIARHSPLPELTLSPGSIRAQNMAIVLQLLRDRAEAAAVSRGRTPDIDDMRLATAATGTRIANHLAEEWVHQQYLRPDLLEERGLIDVTAWVSVFAGKKSVITTNAAGTSITAVEKIATYANLPQMLALTLVYTDIVTRDQIPVKLPALHGGARQIITIQPGEELRDFIADLDIRLAAYDPETSWYDNPLKVLSDGRNVALDPALAGLVAELTHTRVYAVARNILTVYHDSKNNRYRAANGELHPVPGALQIAFCDRGTPTGTRERSFYSALKTLLVEGIAEFGLDGMPSEKVAFIHDARKPSEKRQLVDDCRNGHIAVLLGSTDKMGTGMNIQIRALAEHHIDVPWRPDLLEQREGRIIRQHNQNELIYLFIYVVEGSIDTFMWSKVQNKAEFIELARRGDIDIDEIEQFDEADIAQAAALTKAVATGDMRFIRMAEVEQLVRQLSALEEGHAESVHRARWRLRSLPADIRHLNKLINAATPHLAAAAAWANQPGILVVGGQHFTDRGKANTALLAATRAYFLEANAAIKHGSAVEPRAIATIDGHPVIATLDRRGGVLYLKIGELPVSAEIDRKTLFPRVSTDGEDPRSTASKDAHIARGLNTRISNAYAGLDAKVIALRADLDQDTADLNYSRSVVDTPFERTEELLAAKVELTQLRLDIDAAQNSPEAIAAREAREQRLAAQGREPGWTRDLNPTAETVRRSEWVTKSQYVAAKRAQMAARAAAYAAQIHATPPAETPGCLVAPSRDDRVTTGDAVPESPPTPAEDETGATSVSDATATDSGADQPTTTHHDDPTPTPAPRARTTDTTERRRPITPTTRRSGGRKM